MEKITVGNGKEREARDFGGFIVGCIQCIIGLLFAIAIIGLLFGTVWIIYSPFKVLAEDKRIKNEFQEYIEDGYKVQIGEDIILDDVFENKYLEFTDALGVNHEKKIIYFSE